MRNQIVIVAAAFIIGLSIIGARFVPRYEISATVDKDGTSLAWRVNSLTGDVQICSLDRSNDPFEKFAPPGGEEFDVTCKQSFGGLARRQ